MLPSTHHLFQGRPWIFQQNNCKLYSACIIMAMFHSPILWVLKWPACSQNRSPTHKIWSIMKRKMRQRRPRTVEQVKSYIRQECDNIALLTVQQLVSSDPRCLQCCKKKRENSQWETRPSLNFSETWYYHHIQNDPIIFLKWNNFSV